MTSVASSVGHLQDGPTAVKPTYRLIQVLRAVAALMVVFHHETISMWERLGVMALGGNWLNGGAGVDVFFIISGFVMTISSAPLEHSKHPARTFLARRLERVLPMYWLLTTLKVVLVLADPANSRNGLGSPLHVVMSYLLLPSSGGEPLLVVGWTLIFEMAFYALFALALWLRWRVEYVLIPVIVTVVLLGHLPQAPGPIRYYGENSLALEFLFGVLLARALPWVKMLPVWLAGTMFTVAWAPLFLWRSPNVSNWRAFQWGLVALVIVGTALALESRWGWRTPKWMLELGDASYSIYLTHGIVLPFCMVALMHLPKAVTEQKVFPLAVMLILSVAVGDLVYRMVELPLTRWFKGRRRTAVPAVADKG